MLTSLGVAALLGILGTFAAVLYAVVLAFGGAPGSVSPILGTRYGKRGLITTGTALSFLVESYLLLTFAAFVVRFVDAFLTPRPDAPAWPLWIVGWYLATAPVLFGGRACPAPPRATRQTPPSRSPCPSQPSASGCSSCGDRCSSGAGAGFRRFSSKTELATECARAAATLTDQRFLID